MSAPPLWPAQQEAVEFALARPATMLDMDMGTGKTRTAIEIMTRRSDVRRVLVVCPRAVIPVWPKQLGMFAPGRYRAVEKTANHPVKVYADEVWLSMANDEMAVYVVNYESVWRKPLGDLLYKAVKDGDIDMIILDESHRAKAAGSKVSKYLAMVGRHVKYRLCLSGTPMANSPLDVYGQYRFLDRTIYGTNHERFLQQYAIMGGPDRNFVVGYKNQQDLMDRFKSIAYSCRMEDVRDRLKLPDLLPDSTVPVDLPAATMRTMRGLAREFVAEAEGGAPYFAQAELVLVCKKAYWQDMDPAHFLDPEIETHYAQRDYHRIFIGEIVEALRKE